MPAVVCASCGFGLAQRIAGRLWESCSVRSHPYRRDPQGHVARVLAERRRGAEAAAAQSSTSRSRGAARCARTIATRRSEVEQRWSRSVSGIALAPLDDVALVAPVESGAAQRHPGRDLRLGSEGRGDFVSFVATDNEAAASSAGEHLAELLGGKGKVVLLRYAEGPQHATPRAGLSRGLAALPGSSAEQNQYGGATRRRLQARRSLLTRTRTRTARSCRRHFRANESSDVRLMLALQATAGPARSVHRLRCFGRAGRGVRGGEIDALVVQDPCKMGYLTWSRWWSTCAARRSSAVSIRASPGHARQPRRPDIKQLVQPDPPTSPRPETRDAGIEKRFGATIALAGVDSAVRRARVHAPDRRERRRQVHPDEDSVRRDQPDAGT